MTDQASEKKRNTGMKWLKLGKDKDPEFKQNYFLYGVIGSKENPIDDFHVGFLELISHGDSGKVFKWNVQGFDEAQSGFTHYALCVKPVE